jgi:hypothetical protein
MVREMAEVMGNGVRGGWGNRHGEGVSGNEIQ